MEGLSRLAPCDRNRHAQVFICACAQAEPKVVPLINKLVKAIVNKRAVNKHLIVVLRATLTRAEWTLAWKWAHARMIYALLHERTLTNENACHGCLAYAPQLACVKCGVMRFCAGCWDYGECMECDENARNA